MTLWWREGGRDSSGDSFSSTVNFILARGMLEGKSVSCVASFIFLALIFRLKVYN